MSGDTHISTRERRLPDPGLVWDDGVAAAAHFGDVYFSRDGGLAETRHVFLSGCDLPQAWSEADCFTVGELGFGTGRNFLATWELWRKTHKPGARLHYIAVEGYPLTPDELRRCLTPWPELADLAQGLLRVYGAPQPGFHRLFLGDNIFLTLLFGEAACVLEQLEANVDAWFLDGFAPDRNPAMWSSEVFTQIAQLSHAGTRLATYSAASDVRRGLDATGFDITKAPGFGTKREMLRGRFRGTQHTSRLQPWFARPVRTHKQGHAVIIGGGIAGTSAAHALQRRGWRTTIIERNAALADGASGNPVGVLMPRLTAAPNLDGRFYAGAWRTALNGLSDINDRCGLLQLATDGGEATRHIAIAANGLLPESFLSYVTADQASDIADCKVQHSALYFPQGGWCDPRAFCHALSAASDVILNTAVGALHHDGSMWRIMNDAGDLVMQADVVVLANAHGAAALPASAWLPLQVRRGQITMAPPTPHSRGLRTVLTYGGYMTPAHNGAHSIGATFDWVAASDLNTPPPVIAKDHVRNLDDLARVLPDIMTGLDMDALTGRAGFRCTTLDHLPMAGPLPSAETYQRDFAELRHGHPWARYPEAVYQPGLYTLTGLGARGLVSAPLAAEIVASHICGEPWPLERDLVTALHPARILVRDLKRREA